MQEWLNWLAWKACIPQKGIGGSNPPHSARQVTINKRVTQMSKRPKNLIFCVIDLKKSAKLTIFDDFCRLLPKK